MNKNALIFIGIVLALIGGSFAFLAAKPDTSTSDTVESIMQQSAKPGATAPTQQAPVTTTGAGTYTDYSEANLASAGGQRILFFHAPWCGQCRQLDADMKKAGAIPDNYTILKVDFDSNQDLRQKYGVTFRTAYVKIDANGKRIDKPYIAYDEPTFAAVKRDFL